MNSWNASLEAIELCLKVEEETIEPLEFVGVQRILVQEGV
jgi:predicted RNase H-like HicB family nuclease